MALLANQAWRLLLQPDFLIARVLKENIFQIQPFLKSSSGSWIWKSTLQRDLLTKGLRWRISDGKNINVWIDPWIPNNNGFIPKSIHRHTKTWNYEV